MSRIAPPTRPEHGDDEERHERPGVQLLARARRSGRGAMPLNSFVDEPASSSPNTTQHDRCDRAAEGRPADDARARRAARQVARVVGGGVDPAEPEAGEHEHEHAERSAVPTRTGMADTLCQSILSATSDDVDDREDAGDDGDDRLRAHDQVEAHDPADDHQRGDDDHRDHLGRRCRCSSRAGRRRWMSPASQGWSAPSPSRRSAPTTARPARTLPRTPNAARLSTIVGAEPRLPARAMNPQSRNDSTMPRTPAIAACQNETVEGPQERAVADAQHRHVRAEPRPEQLRGCAAPLVVADDLDAVGLDAQRARARFSGGSALLRRHHRRAPLASLLMLRTRSA